jgi:adenylosuccinate synthase
MRATAVIGACFGDEGKGLVTDYLASQDPDKTVVVRFNGGAQAGHTVVNPDNHRHVFSHFGAGSLAGASTYLSQYFICNPFLWQKERKQLSDIDRWWLPSKPLYIHEDALLTTPYDMLVNREAEMSRGDKKHGSCGIGINETVHRCQNPDTATRISDICRPGWLRKKLVKLREVAIRRMVELGVPRSSHFMDIVDSNLVAMNYMRACDEMLGSTVIGRNAIVKNFHRHVVFEGAQGLLLDECNEEFFPHVTRSRTGLTNVVKLCKEHEIDHLDVVYVTRCYMTRHGAGPFPTERSDMSFKDDTNNSNEWQGSLRFGSLDLPRIREAVNKDILGSSGISVSPKLAITHIDQLPDTEPWDTASKIGLKLGYESSGPARNHVTEVIG